MPFKELVTVIKAFTLTNGILLGVGLSVISIIIYLYWLPHQLPGQGIFDHRIFVRRPAVFAYGVAVGISIVSTAALAIAQIGQKLLELLEHKAGGTPLV